MRMTRLALAFMLAGTATCFGQVLINEVHGFGSSAGLPGDYIELWNQSSTPYDLSNHTLSLWVGDTGSLISVVIPCAPNNAHIVNGNCFWIMQEGGTLGDAPTGSLAGIPGMQGLPATWTSGSSMGALITDPSGNCIAYVYLRRGGSTLPASPPNLVAPCTWVLGDIAASGSGNGHIQRATNTNTSSYVDWVQDATSNPGTPGAPNTTGAATQAAIGPCVPASVGIPFQANSPGCSLDVNNTTPNPLGLMVVSALTCDPTLSANLRSQNVGMGFDVALSTRNALAGPGGCGGTGNGAFVSANGQIVSIDFTDPGLLYLNGGANFSTSTTFPGDHVLPIITSITTPLVTMQMHILSPSHPDGAEVSGVTELTIAAFTTMTLSLSDDSSVSVSVAPLCIGSSTVDFYGTPYSAINVISNGRVMFGGTNTGFTPTVSQALIDSPSIGFWTDLNPSSSGSGQVTVESTGSELKVRWNNVYYFGTTTGVTYEVSYVPSSATWSLNGLNGIVADPSAGNPQYLGVSSGSAGGATSAGITAFAVGASGTPALATDAMYDFWDGQAATAPNGVNLLGSIQSGVQSIRFVPSGATYTWSAF